MSDKTYVLKKQEIRQIIREECERSLKEINDQNPSGVELKEKTRKAVAILSTEFVDLHHELAAHLASAGTNNKALIELIKTFGQYVESLSQILESID